MRDLRAASVHPTMGNINQNGKKRDQCTDEYDQIITLISITEGNDRFLTGHAKGGYQRRTNWKRENGILQDCPEKEGIKSDWEEDGSADRDLGRTPQARPVQWKRQRKG